MIFRAEQIAPFPMKHLKEELTKYKNAKTVWVQEEHRNMGGWKYAEERINIVS